MASPSFWYLAVFAVVIAAFYASISRPPTTRQVGAWILLFVAAIPLYQGGRILLSEYRRSQDGRVVHGTVVEKPLQSEIDAEARRLRGRGRRATDLAEIPEAIARLVATGSTDAWLVEYRYDCGGAMCRGRDVVSERVWSTLAVGDPVSVRPAGGHTDAPRLDANSPWPMALGRLCVGGVLLVGAAFALGRFSRGPRFLTAPAVVTEVATVESGTGWRVKFAYFAPDGTALESADEVFIEGVKPGDECVAVYPPEHPDLGSLRLLPRA